MNDSNQLPSTRILLVTLNSTGARFFKTRKLSDLYCPYQFYSVQYRFVDWCDFALNQDMSLKMNNQKLLKASLESIKELRAELLNDMDSSKRKKLDQIIKDLECCEGQQISPNQILKLFGKALALLPALERIWDELNK